MLLYVNTSEGNNLPAELINIIDVARNNMIKNDKKQKAVEAGKIKLQK